VRRHARGYAFRVYFDGAHEISLDLAQIIIQRTSPFNGRPMHDPRFLYAERTPEGLTAVARGAAPSSHGDAQVLPRHFADNLLCVVADRNGLCLGLALINTIDFASRIVSLDTPIAKHRIHILQLGDLYLDRSGRELHRGRLGHFSAVSMCG